MHFFSMHYFVYLFFVLQYLRNLLCFIFLKTFSSERNRRQHNLDQKESESEP